MQRGSWRSVPLENVTSRDGAAKVLVPPSTICLMSDDLLELEGLLREKDEIIDALTERLEMTAEQLDRMQRANGDRGHWLSGGVPAELVEQQQTLCEDLGRVVQQWEATQPGVTLSRIEMQLQELRDLVVQHPGGTGHFHEAPVRHRPAAEESEHATPSGVSGWEALKAGLLAQNPPTDGVSEEQHASYGNPQGEDYARTTHESGPDPFNEPLNIPAAIEVDSAGIINLRSAVIERDEFIAELLRRLRIVEGRTRPSDTWKGLESTPEDLRERLESLEQRLEQALRMSEVELSLERAKLGREAMRLKHLEESTQKAMARLGMGATDHHDDDDDEPVAQHDGSADGRWRRMLGIKREK